MADTQCWRDRAEQARTKAKQMNDAEARWQMLEIAAAYDGLAERTEERLPTEKSPAVFGSAQPYGAKGAGRFRRDRAAPSARGRRCSPADSARSR
jgi:hypothetical protein